MELRPFPVFEAAAITRQATPYRQDGIVSTGVEVTASTVALSSASFKASAIDAVDQNNTNT